MIRLPAGARVVVAPAPWKGSYGAAKVAAAIAHGLAEARPDLQIEQIPVADGGEGTVDALDAAWGGRRERATVRDPRGRPVEATWLRLPGGGTGVCEVASACGLPRLTDAERDPWLASSAGVGDLLRAMAGVGVRAAIVGIGGTATVDGGMGLLQALGARVPGVTEGSTGGAALAAATGLVSSSLQPPASGLRVRCLTDVDAPLLGPTGAARAFGPQKGADPAMVERLEAAMARWAAILAEATGRDPRTGPPGMGAGGGLAAACWAALGATIEPGAEAILRAARFRERTAGAALVVTGEGRLDATTRLGKAPLAVARAARALGVPCAWIVGSRAPGADPGGPVVEAGTPDRPATLDDIADAARDVCSGALPAPPEPT